MHALPRPVVIEMLSELRLAVVAVEQTNAAGKGFVSYRYCAAWKA